MTGTYHITLLRHGRTKADDEKRFEGRFDSPLTGGVEQAKALAQQWQTQERCFDRIICSPLSRAVQTAEIIAQALGKTTVEQEPLWEERNWGKVAGMLKEEAARLYPLPSFIGPYDRVNEGTTESEVEVHARAARATQSLLNHPEGRYLVVAHAGILNAALRCMLGLPLPISNQGVSFAFGDTGYWDLRYQRDRHHWTVVRR
jgi:2,3-bisphosphoglycerate-dependent phosphoglycerate mutase